MRPLSNRERFEFVCAILLAVVVAIGVTVAIRSMTSPGLPALTQTVPAPSPEVKVVRELPPCEYEDSTNCIWDASEQGNGEGISFVDIDGVAYYPEQTWQGFAVGEVIVCTDGTKVSVDQVKAGSSDTWAACM